jgi:serine/threonine-protein kinase
MCPNCSFDNPDDAAQCSNCPSPLYRLLGHKTLLADRYSVVSVLGNGAMGAVYLAEDQRLASRRCAIKENRPGADENPEVLIRLREQFLAEANVLARLDHPGLPKVSDYFIANENREYLVMDYVEGEDLNSMLERIRQPLEEDVVIGWADQVLDALAYLHNQRPQPIIHRDIKPANLRLNLQGRVKLVDFGLVKLFDAGNPETKFELRGLGTPAYAPLEQFASSDQHTDTRSDIYALGATLYHLLTNLYPPDVHQRVLHPEVLLPPRHLNPNLSKNTEAIILKAMEILPDRRYQSAEEMRQALGGQTQAQPAAVVSPWAFAIIGFALVLLILGGVAWILFGVVGNQTPTPNAAAVIEGQPVEGAPVEAVLPEVTKSNPTDTPTRVLQNTVAPLQDAPAGQPGSSTTNTPTPLPQNPNTVISATTEITPTTGATATPRPEPQGVPGSSLVGVIAYPVFNGTDYDLYFGQADGSGSQLFRNHASQPAFSPDGSRLAFHSWKLDDRGLMTIDLSGENLRRSTNFFEDQLPTWSADGSELVLLTRRSGDRKSQLVRMDSYAEIDQGTTFGEGEYPTVGLNGQLVFKGWGNTADGLKISSPAFDEVQPLTDSADDTAPALSPDGHRVVFMSNRDGNWEIYMVNADGSDLRRLTDNAAPDGLPVWSPDGRAIAFVSDRGDGWAVWVMLPNGQGQRQLFAMEGSPDGMVGGDTYTSRGWTEERLSWKP